MKKLLLITLLLGISFSAWAEGCSVDEPLVIAEGRSCVDGWENGKLVGECGYHKLCADCSYPDEVQTTLENCALCPNRDYKDGKCIFRECPEGSIKSEDNYNQYCSRCDARWYINTTKEECHKCPDRLWGISIHSIKEEEKCYSCKNKDDPVITSAEECARCPDFVYNPETKLCGTDVGEEWIEWKKWQIKMRNTDLPLAPLPGIKEDPAVVSLPIGKETAINNEKENR